MALPSSQSQGSLYGVNWNPNRIDFTIPDASAQVKGAQLQAQQLANANAMGDTLVRRPLEIANEYGAFADAQQQREAAAKIRPHATAADIAAADYKTGSALEAEGTRADTEGTRREAAVNDSEVTAQGSRERAKVSADESAIAARTEALRKDSLTQEPLAGTRLATAQGTALEANLKTRNLQENAPKVAATLQAATDTALVSAKTGLTAAELQSAVLDATKAAQLRAAIASSKNAASVADFDAYLAATRAQSKGVIAPLTVATEIGQKRISAAIPNEILGGGAQAAPGVYITPGAVQALPEVAPAPAAQKPLPEVAPTPAAAQAPLPDLGPAPAPNPKAGGNPPNAAPAPVPASQGGMNTADLSLYNADGSMIPAPAPVVSNTPAPSAAPAVPSLRPAGAANVFALRREYTPEAQAKARADVNESLAANNQFLAKVTDLVHQSYDKKTGEPIGTQPFWDSQAGVFTDAFATAVGLPSDAAARQRISKDSSLLQSDLVRTYPGRILASEFTTSANQIPNKGLSPIANAEVSAGMAKGASAVSGAASFASELSSTPAFVNVPLDAIHKQAQDLAYATAGGGSHSFKIPKLPSGEPDFKTMEQTFPRDAQVLKDTVLNPAYYTNGAVSLSALKPAVQAQVGPLFRTVNDVNQRGGSIVSLGNAGPEGAVPATLNTPFLVLLDKRGNLETDASGNAVIHINPSVRAQAVKTATYFRPNKPLPPVQVAAPPPGSY